MKLQRPRRQNELQWEFMLESYVQRVESQDIEGIIAARLQAGGRAGGRVGGRAGGRPG
jgi:hypothetical protein